MQKNLVIVESPAKAKTIEKFLGKDFTVMSSYGHIRDLKDKEFSVDIENNYTPTYVVPSDKKKLVTELRKAAKAAEVVWLASDEDREGEAIAWHLYEELKLKNKETQRIVFHEITKPAILKAIENPRTIDMNLVDAQQARRVLDRIVGFELSPVLWRKIKPSLSAGRVQSVTVRLVVEREREINKFEPTASFRIIAIFKSTGDASPSFDVKSELKTRFNTEEEAYAFLESCKAIAFSVEGIEKKPLKRSPAAPFTTSTLQQEASRKHGFPVGTTMRVAQALYESGKITYMRTDSVNLSDIALNAAQEEIAKMAGENYHKVRKYHTKAKGAQEAHEAIRPTDFSKHTISGTAQEKKLYELIWKRTVASQMADAVLEKTTVTIQGSGLSQNFVATGEVIKFDGFLKVYIEGTDDEGEHETSNMLPPMQIGQALDLKEMSAQERFSQRPSRYTEASLVRKLEELGIGRPSTYAPTISTIQRREYVVKKELQNQTQPQRVILLKDNEIEKKLIPSKTTIEKGKLSPTDVGIVVNDFLCANFPNIMNYNFTADVEGQFDEVAEGKKDWTKNLNDFYVDFHPNVEKAIHLEGRKAGERELGIDPKSGKPIFVKIGRYGAVAQIGEATDEEKPKFSALREGQSIETISLEEALELFKLPMSVGEFEGEEMTVAVGRFGPYVKHAKSFVSIPKEIDPLTVTTEMAIELIQEKRKADKNREIHIFEAEDIKVLNGRYGAYIVHGGANYKIPKTLKIKAEDLTLEDCQAIVADESNKSGGRKKYKKK